MPAIHSTIDQRQRTAATSNAPRPRRSIRATLSVAGGVAVAVGGAIALAPRPFIDIDGEPTADLLSETRAPGGALLVVGVFIVFAAIRNRHLDTAATMAALVYLGYGLARTASTIVDGRPSGFIIGATIVELALGVASLAAAIASVDGTRVERQDARARANLS